VSNLIVVKEEHQDENQHGSNVPIANEELQEEN
jgi:hypothetical protein